MAPQPIRVEDERTLPPRVWKGDKDIGLPYLTRGSLFC